MITTEYTNYKGMNVFGLSWLFVNPNPITLMEQLENVPSKIKVLKNRNPGKFLTYRDLFVGVPGRTRTVDIQNHKQWHRTLGIPFIHRCFRRLRKSVLRRFCGDFSSELKTRDCTFFLHINTCWLLF